MQQRIIGGTFTPHSPERIYIPKQSGLHRPLALLGIEDQIVLQAFANIAAKKLQQQRTPLQLKVVFSNILENPHSIFFFHRWQTTYNAFQQRIKKFYNDNKRWVGDFDLAAFYDTVSHELLLRTIYPRTINDDLKWFETCLKTWSSDRIISGHGHGLPQGPIASDFLAECFLLPIDQLLRKHHGYIRYVDDVRLFGATEDEVRANLIELERNCRERGLIPQVGKFVIKQIHSLKDALGALPSIVEPQHGNGDQKLSIYQTVRIFTSAIGKKPYRNIDKTRLRFVLYRAGINNKILKQVLKLIPHHPEFADVFFTYLGHFGYRKIIERLCLILVEQNPYPYLRGEAWHILARYRKVRRSITTSNSRMLISKAIRIAKTRIRENFAERWGTCHFLCVSDEMMSTNYSKFLMYQTPLLQSLLAPVLPDVAFSRNGAVVNYLKRTVPEPGLSICAKIHVLNLHPSIFGLRDINLPSQVLNTLRELRVISGPRSRVDPIGEILNTHYGIPIRKSWYRLLNAEYIHALGLLKQAKASFNSGFSFWLQCQNSFNQTIFLALQYYFHSTSHPAACTITDRNGKLVDFGVTLDPNGPFSQNCPFICNAFRQMNIRRNHLPQSHPYEKETIAQAKYLTKQERNKFVAMLRRAYANFILYMP